MSKKMLDENAIVNELREGSVFFSKTSDSPASVKNKPPQSAGNDKEPIPESLRSNRSIESVLISEETAPKRIKKPLMQESNRASTLASYQASMIDEIRKSVKALGKEVSFVRITTEEKNQIVDIVYTYRRQGVRTSENEIHRIALNSLLSDFKTNGKSSILARVIDALLA